MSGDRGSQIARCWFIDFCHEHTGYRISPVFLPHARAPSPLVAASMCMPAVVFGQVVRVLGTECRWVLLVRSNMVKCCKVHPDVLRLILRDLLSALWQPEGLLLKAGACSMSSFVMAPPRVGMGDVVEGGKVCRSDHEICGPFAALAGF